MLKKLILTISVLAAAFQLQAQQRPAHTVNPQWQQAFDAANEVLHDNLRGPNGKNPHFQAHPSPKYAAVYLWDSAFISLIWKHQDLNVAQDIIRGVLYNQKPDGRVPHQVNLFGTSQWSQPPLLTWAAVRLTENKSEADMAFTKEIYPKLKSFHAWYRKTHSTPSGLYFWDHPYESGIDNSPRFGNRDESKYVDTHGLEVVDLCSYMVMDAESLSQMALTLGLTEDSQAFAAEAKATAALVRARLWDNANGNFYDFDLKTNKFVPFDTIASLFPMVAGIADQTQALKLIERIKSPKGFNTFIPFPSVERGSPSFEKDTWRGPVWINTAYLGLLGLKRYGQMATFNNMASRLVDGIYKTYYGTGDFLEFYDPDRLDTKELSRKKGLGFLGLSASRNILKVAQHLIMKQLFLGTKPVDRFVGWTGLVNTLVLEENLTPPQ